jgi:hypothetical protein
MTGLWPCAAAGTGHSKAVGAYTGVLSGSRGSCTGGGVSGCRKHCSLPYKDLFVPRQRLSRLKLIA